MTDASSGRAEPAWLAVRVEPAGDPQRVIDALFAVGSQGVQEDGSAIVTHFPPGTGASEIERIVRAADPAAMVTSAPAPTADWSAWKASVRAHRVGEITITPPWLAGSNPDSIEIVIDPAMAFGTGEHATTRGVVRLMQRLPRLPEMVADIGAGSAVLAICAARLGAARVVAIELDPDAIENAEANVAANGVTRIVHVIEGDASVILPLVSPVGLVLANIISSILLDLLPVIGDSLDPRGYAILSGILREERPVIVTAAEAAGWAIVSEDAEDEWWSVLVERTW